MSPQRSSVPLLFLLLLLLLILLSSSFAQTPLSTLNAGRSVDRFEEFITTITSLKNSGAFRIVHFSSNHNDDVVSEGQGYGLLMGGLLAARLPPTEAKYEQYVTNAHELYLGWREMAWRSKADGHCQSSFYCSATGLGDMPCLPHWRFNHDLSSINGKGAAPDGDEDAILGMILLVYGTEARSDEYPWWSEVANFAYSSCKAFYEFNTVAYNSNASYRILKLGTCWGGVDCNNPSYHAPGAMRVFRNYMERMGPLLGKGTEGADYVSKWNDVISTSYDLLSSAQCSTTGLITNWFVPNQSDPAGTGTTACSGSGTPAGEYGSEAARTTWRVVLDQLWFDDESDTQTFTAKTYSNRVSAHVATKHNGGTAFSNLDTGCLVTSIHSDWRGLAFMAGPTLTSLTIPSSSATQQSLLDDAGTLLASYQIQDYYAGAWVVISTMTVNGDFSLVRDLVRQTSGGSPVPPPPPPPPAPSSGTPTTGSPTTGSSGSGSCSYGIGTNTYWIEVESSTTSGSAYVLCANRGDSQLPCIYDGDLGKWICQVNDGVECQPSRNVYFDGVCCQLDSTPCPASPTPSTVSPTPSTASPTPSTVSPTPSTASPTPSAATPTPTFSSPTPTPTFTSTSPTPTETTSQQLSSTAASLSLSFSQSLFLFVSLSSLSLSLLL